MKRFAQGVLALMLLALLVGCSNLLGPFASATSGGDSYWLRPAGVRPSSDAVSLLYYVDYLRNLSAADQEQERERQRKAYAKDKSDFHRFQYALALSAPAAAAADRRQALQLLEPLSREAKGHDPELHLLAQLLFSELRRSEELERKLEALKDIERSLLQRDRGPQGSKP